MHAKQGPDPSDRYDRLPRVQKKIKIQVKSKNLVHDLKSHMARMQGVNMKVDKSLNNTQLGTQNSARGAN